MRTAVLLLAAIMLAGCAYHPRSPTQLDEAIRLQVVADQGRFPRAGPLLQEEATDRIAVQTGWRIRPDGSARLDLSLDADRISASGDDKLGVPTRWRIMIRGTAMLVTRHGTRTTTFSGSGYASTIEQEATALRAAAADAANHIALWLQQVDLDDKPLPKP